MSQADVGDIFIAISGLGGIVAAESHSYSPAPIVIVVEPLSSVSWHFAAAGNDSTGDGSAGSPFRTIAKANALTYGIDDEIRFNGGDSFDDARLLLTLTNCPYGKIKVTSYGTGRATIEPTGGTPIRIVSVPYVEVSELHVVGDGAPGTYGIDAHNPATTNMPGLYIHDNEVEGAGEKGIYVQARVSLAEEGDISVGLIQGPRIEYNTVHDCVNGIETKGAWLEDVQVRHITAPKINHNIIYDCTRFGIVTSMMTGGEARGNIIHDITGHGDGSYGMFCGDGDDFDQYENYVYNIQAAPGAFDGSGVGIDGNTNRCRSFRNFTRNCSGSGQQIYSYELAPIVDAEVFLNISVNDGYSTDAASNAHAPLSVGANDTGEVVSFYAYNNVFYTDAASKPAVRIGQGGSGPSAGFVFNNIIAGADKAIHNVGGQPVLFQGNCYADSQIVHWNGVNYASIALWQAAQTTQEKVSAMSVAVIANPLLYNMGEETVLSGEFDPDELGAYRPTLLSPLFGEGIDHASIANPTTDLFGGAADAGFDIGVGYEASAVAAPAAPEQFGTGDWSVADRAGYVDEATVTLIALPDSDLSISRIEYQVGSQPWRNLGRTTPGTATIYLLTNGVSNDVKLRAVSNAGTGTASAVKTVTPTGTNRYSAEQDLSAWDSVYELTATAGQTDPLGGTAAYRFIETVANDYHYVGDNSVARGTDLVFRAKICLRAIGARDVAWLSGDELGYATGAIGWADFAAKAFENEDPYGGNETILNDFQVVDLGYNDWLLLVLDLTWNQPLITNISLNFGGATVALAAANNTGPYTGNTSNGFYAFRPVLAKVA